MVETGAFGGKGGIDHSAVAENIIPSADDTYDLGSSAKRWAALYVVLALVTSLTIGGAVKLSTVGNVLFINDSTQIQGDLTINDSLFVIDGNVGIGTTNPGELLHVSGGNILLDNAQQIRMKDAGGTENNVLTLTSAEYTDELILGAGSGIDNLSLATGGIRRLFINNLGNIGIGTTSPSEILHVIGQILLDHTATESDDHGLELIIDAAGFGDVKGLFIDYITGAIVTGEDEEVILINIDQSLANGGDVVGLEILATEGGANIYGLEAGALVNPVLQLSGIFDDMDSALHNTTNVRAAFISTSTDVPIFTADNDFVTIGDASKFEEIEFLLDTTASNPGIKPTFEYSTGVNNWTEFNPTDGTNGLRNTGIIAWLDADIPLWAVGTGTEFLIRINRTQNSLQTTPIEDKVQISAITEYIWDKNGYLNIKNITTTGNVTIEKDLIVDGFIYGNGSKLTDVSGSGKSPVVVTTSYNMATASGNQNITGAGGTPTAVIGYAVVQDQIGPSVGMADASSEGGILWGTDSAEPITTFLKINLGGGNNQAGTFSSFNSDGMVISWVKSGTPTGTMAQKFMFFF